MNTHVYLAMPFKSSQCHSMRQKDKRSHFPKTLTDEPTVYPMLMSVYNRIPSQNPITKDA